MSHEEYLDNLLERLKYWHHIYQTTQFPIWDVYYINSQYGRTKDIIYNTLTEVYKTLYGQKIFLESVNQRQYNTRFSDIITIPKTQFEQLQSYGYLFDSYLRELPIYINAYKDSMGHSKIVSNLYNTRFEYILQDPKNKAGDKRKLTFTDILDWVGISLHVIEANTDNPIFEPLSYGITVLKLVDRMIKDNQKSEITAINNIGLGIEVILQVAKLLEKDPEMEKKYGKANLASQVLLKTFEKHPSYKPKRATSKDFLVFKS
ncbi:MAG: hypothetical protein ATN35_08110 [Epulopiscium sp. Nele67-Bin004]|nr:MAG: hypothetical protein ATN35_08110 [Epulopiscium sp. Nele67-Bin004]